MYAWIDSGATFGVVRGSYGDGSVPMLDGKWKRVSLLVVEVEAERSKIYIGIGVDRTAATHSVVQLNPPLECRPAK
jgi:hypothetical protein